MKARPAVYLLAFALGTTAAMAVFTRAVGRLGHALSAPHALLGGAVALGGFWLIG